MKAARDFTPEVLHNVLIRALRLIAPDDTTLTEIPDKLPANVAARHRVATATSNAIRSLGYGGEQGYNQLLYPNERDVRRLLSWVIQRLPRSDDGGQMGGEGSAAGLLFRNVPSWCAKPTGRSQVASARSTVSCTAAWQSYDSCLAAGLSVSASARQQRPARADGANTAARLRDSVAVSFRAAASVPTPDPAFLLSLSAAEGGRIGATALPAPSLEEIAAAAKATSDAKIVAGGLNPRADTLFPGTRLDEFPAGFTRRAAFAVQVVRGAPPVVVAAPAAATATVETVRAKTEEEIQKEREEELAALAEQVESATAELDSLVSRRQLLEAALPQVKAQVAAASTLTSELESSFIVRRACLEMLPEAAANLSRLEGEIAEGVRRMMALTAEWEAHRVPLAAAIQAEEDAANALTTREGFLQQSAQKMRAEMSEMQQAAAAREEQAQRMAAELKRFKAAMEEAASGGGEAVLTRPGYTRRILDVVRQIRKQKAEIGKIVKDVRSVQAELVGLSDKLRKTAAQAMETMEKAATENAKEAVFRQAFRQLVTLQDTFSELVSVVTAAGQTDNEIRDLDNRIEQLAQRNDAANTQQLLRDIAQLKQDTAALQASAQA